MTKTNKLGFIALPLLTLLVIPTLTHAQNIGANVGVNVTVGPGMRGPGKDSHDGRMYKGDDDDRKMGTSTRSSMFLGSITTIASPSFTILTRERGATTTVKVMTDANTSFKLGTTTSAFANLALGQNVAISGTYSTTTNTLLAQRVDVVTAMGPRGQWNASSTIDGHGNLGKQGFFQRCVNWLKKIF